MMILQKSAWLIVALSLCLLMITACSPSSEPSAPPIEKRILIGLAMDSLVVERWTRDRDSFMARAQELGADVLLQVANEDPDTQNRQITWLINKKVDVIVLIPYDADLVAPAIKEAQAAGIPVLNYDRLARNAGSAAYVSFDNEAIGRMMARALTDAGSRGKILIINGSVRDNNAHLYNKGIHEVIDPLVAAGLYSISNEAWLKDWSNEEAESVVRSVLSSVPASGNSVPNAILCANDFIAEAVTNVLAEKRLAGKVLVIGHDAELSACQRIVEGTQFATIYKPVTRLGELGAEIAIKLAKGESLNATSSLFDGSKDVKAILLDAVTVKADNMMDTVILDGFHRFADVYRNVSEDQRPKTK